MEKIALCAMHHGPSVCCPEFKSRGKRMDASVLYNRFCLKCTNFEDVNGIPICARDHRPGIACGAFKIKETKRNSKKFKQIATNPMF